MASTTKGVAAAGSGSAVSAAPSNALHTQTWMAAMQGVSSQLQAQSPCGAGERRSTGGASSKGSTPVGATDSLLAGSPASPPLAPPTVRPMPSRFPTAFARMGGEQPLQQQQPLRRMAVAPLPLPFSHPPPPPPQLLAPPTTARAAADTSFRLGGNMRATDGAEGGGGAARQAPPAPAPEAPAKKPTAPKWYTSSVFQQFVAVLAVFLLSFILLVAIRPPFAYTKPKDKLAAPKFSASKAALYSLLAAAVAAVVMVVIGVVTKRGASPAKTAAVGTTASVKAQ